MHGFSNCGDQCETLRAGFQVDISTVIRAPGQSCLSLKSDPSPSVFSGVTCFIRAGPFSTDLPVNRHAILTHLGGL